MAKQLNTTIKGRIDDYSFYHDSRYGYLVRKTGGLNSKQYQTDQRYAAARDASAEFSTVSKAGKLIRSALARFIKPVKDGSMVNKELIALKQADDMNPRGKRKPGTKMGDHDANKWLRIFQFNENANLYNTCRNEIPRVHRVHPNNCQVKLQSVAFPDEATHTGLTLIRTVIDFENNNFQTSSSEMKMIRKENQEELSLSTNDLLPKQGTEITCLQIIFFSEKDGKLSQLKEKVHSMGIIDILNIPDTPQIRKRLRQNKKNRLLPQNKKSLERQQSIPLFIEHVQTTISAGKTNSPPEIGCLKNKFVIRNS